MCGSFSREVRGMINVTYDLSGIKDALDVKASLAAKTLSEKILSDCEPYVPYRTGALCRSGHTVADENGYRVVWDASYASECYYASRSFSKRKHPRATARWFDAAAESRGGGWMRLVREIYSSAGSGGVLDPSVRYR